MGRPSVDCTASIPARTLYARPGALPPPCNLSMSSSADCAPADCPSATAFTPRGDCASSQAYNAASSGACSSSDLWLRQDSHGARDAHPRPRRRGAIRAGHPGSSSTEAAACSGGTQESALAEPRGPPCARARQGEGPAGVSSLRRSSRGGRRRRTGSEMAEQQQEQQHWGEPTLAHMAAAFSSSLVEGIQNHSRAAVSALEQGGSSARRTVLFALSKTTHGGPSPGPSHSGREPHAFDASEPRLPQRLPSVASGPAGGATAAAVKVKPRTGGVAEQLLCGAFAGILSRSAIAPIDLVRAHLISSHALEGASKTASGVLQSIYNKEGWIGLFRGNGVNCLRVGPNKAIELCTFEMLKRILGAAGHPLQHIAAPLSGGAAGMAGTIATYPLELMRTRIAIQPERYTSVAATFAKIVKDEGFGSLYRGLPISLFGVFPYAATNYFVYDALRGVYRRATGHHNIPTHATLLFGALAASISSAVTFPLEVARRRLQLGAVGGGPAPTSGLQVLRNICRTEGWPAVYRGLGTTWLKLIPAAGISFVCYEAARHALRVDDASYAAAAAAARAEEEEGVPGRRGVSRQPGGMPPALLSSDGPPPGHASVQGLPALASRKKWGRSGGMCEQEQGTRMLPQQQQPVVGREQGQHREEEDRQGAGAGAGAGRGSVRVRRGLKVEVEGLQWRGAMEVPHLPSPIAFGATMAAVRDGLEEAEDLRVLKKRVSSGV